jgi:hypothetical protein
MSTYTPRHLRIPRHNNPRGNRPPGSIHNLLNEATWGLGFALGRLGAEPDTDLSVFGMGSAGGTFGYADTATGWRSR